MKEIWVRPLIDTALSPINPVDSGYHNCQPSHSYGPAIRSYYLLHFVVSGKGMFSTQSGKFELSANQMFIIRPYEINYYEADANEPWKYIWIGFTSEIPLPPQIMNNDVLTVPFLKRIFEDSISPASFDENIADIGYKYYLCGLIHQIFGLLLRGDAEKRVAAEDYVRRAVSVIESEYHHELSVETIASKLHLNRSYFSELFKRETGISPHKYLTDYRMKKAAELLTKRGFSVSVTALSVGYPDVFVFSRAFKGYFKISPTDYIKKYRK